jgi:hypothetical protein
MASVAGRKGPRTGSSAGTGSVPSGRSTTTSSIAGGPRDDVESPGSGHYASPAITIKFLELGAKVLDRTEEAGRRVVHFHIHINVNAFALLKAGEERGLIRRPALPPQGR